MLRRLQRLRQHIRYHSAPRPSNRWSRAMDFAFIAAFLLAFPAALLADLAARDSRTSITLPGILAQSSLMGGAGAAGGRIEAWLMNGQNGRGGSNSRAAPESGETIIGNFELSVTDDLRGWPLITTIERRPARLTIDIVAEARARRDVPRDRDDVLQKAIEKALIVDDEPEALAAWDLTDSQTRRQWWAWFPAIGAWWMLMFALSAVTIQLLRFTSLWLTGNKRQREYRRQAEGKCAACGYDMTGLEFNERCPECGANVW